ncbi:MAG: FecR domain-containing protein [Planctomycetaceae bacterium]|nr:FecR domain-containing protein [Planctomycetaceae bacterium]
MSFDRTDFHNLLNALLNGTLTAEQHALLQSILYDNESAQQEYLDYIDLHLGLKELQHMSEDVAVPCLDDGSASRRTMNRRTWLLAATSVAAVTVAVCLGIWQANGLDPAVEVPVAANEVNQNSSTGEPQSSPSPVRLTQAANVELFQEYVPELGTPLKLDHEYIMLKGSMELTFDCGATAVLSSPSVFTVTSPKRLEMKVGHCSVYAPDEAKGFEVITPQSRIVDLGTRFTVVARDTGSSEVQVFEGAVEVHPPNTTSSEKSLLMEGAAARTTGVNAPLQQIPFDRHLYQSRLPDRVISYAATEDSPGQGVRELESVTVQRGGQVLTHGVDELIGVDVIHFSAFRTSNNAASDSEHAEHVETFLSEDHALTTGLPNFDRAPGPFVPPESYERFRERDGLAVRFRRPVINGPGPDVVLFELQSVEYPASGDRVHVSPIEDGEGLRTHLVEHFDITLNSVNARRVAQVYSHVFESPVRSVDDFSQLKIKNSFQLALPFYALAVGIDLSDLGYPEGAPVPGLFFEDAEDENRIILDPVLIGGFPPPQSTKTGSVSN